MVTVEEAIIAKYSKEGRHFEILVDPHLAYDLKEGRTVSLSRMLASNVVFTDARKADKASPSDIEKTFNTNDLEKIAEFIVKHGEVQLTTDFRRKKTEEKRKQVASFISRNAINPQTRVPHPPERILAAMESARVNIDPFRPAEQQVDDVVKAIKSILPISIEEIVLSIEIPAKYSSRAYGLLKELGTIQKDNWLSDGSLFAKLLIPAGLKESVFRRLGAVTEGNVKVTEEPKR
ncbi:MAG: ribosome assembly factor SBDS [Candidatus Aenigmarchaeota archaeon]|nr:ribosome assembly factor SBDS [Candidatus Aenigmarchaeota archaeon]